MKADFELESVSIKFRWANIFGLVVTTKSALRKMKIDARTITITNIKV